MMLFDLILAVFSVVGTYLAFRILGIIDPSVSLLPLPKSWKRVFRQVR